MAQLGLTEPNSGDVVPPEVHLTAPSSMASTASIFKNKVEESLTDTPR